MRLLCKEGMSQLNIYSFRIYIKRCNESYLKDIRQKVVQNRYNHYTCIPDFAFYTRNDVKPFRYFNKHTCQFFQSSLYQCDIYYSVSACAFHSRNGIIALFRMDTYRSNTHQGEEHLTCSRVGVRFGFNCIYFRIRILAFMIPE